MTRHKSDDPERKAALASNSGNAGDRLKIIVRRLPPNLPEEVFWQSVRAWVTDDSVTWKSFWPGKFRKKAHKENVPSRAYIAFKDDQILLNFSREYNGHLFRDKAGNESHAVVEFAPYQKVPPERKKVDARIGTIEKDEDFQSFIQSLEKEAAAEPVSMEALLASIQHTPQPTTTPLLEALKAEKQANKDKESILRNHAHYKDSSVLGSAAAHASSSKRDRHHGAASGDTHQTKKGAAGAKQPAVHDPLPPMSKKSAKKLAAAQKHQAGKAQAQAQAQAQSQSTAAAGNSSKPPPPGSKAAKAAIRQAGGEQGGSASAKGKAATAVPSSSSTVADSAAPGSAAPAASGSSSAANVRGGAPASAPRRSRPMIGAASRHFEAALSGAGVSARERKAREAEREGTSASGGGGGAKKDSAPAGGSAGGPGGPAPAAVTSQPAVPVSPKKERKKDHHHPGGVAPPPKVPGILQRAPEGAASGSASAEGGVAQGAGAAGSDAPSRGKGRGRGRGRGGPPPARGGAASARPPADAGRKTS